MGQQGDRGDEVVARRSPPPDGGEQVRPDRLEWVRATYCRDAIEMPEQERFVRRFAIE